MTHLYKVTYQQLAVGGLETKRVAYVGAISLNDVIEYWKTERYQTIVAVEDLSRTLQVTPKAYQVLVKK